jgi:HD-GYP domain-containing protein (c-di-GMP phosphodiesterase class II)
VRTLRSALHVASRLSHERDPETGAHLDRMSRYARVLAAELAADRGLPDEFVEFLFLFAPIHDIGKVAIPDRVLLKKGRLTEEEFEVMKTHVSRGLAIVDDVLAHLGMDDIPQAGLLRNVVRYHHECVDGSGYPDGLAGGAIPLEARIVAVADVFDALTSERPYKSAWSEGEAIGYLRERAGSQFDPSCVDVLIERLDEVRAIRTRFPDEERWGRQSREGYSLDL